MVKNERFLSSLEKDQRSSVFEYSSAERTKKSKSGQVREKFIFLRIGTTSLDKFFGILYDVVQRAVGLFHYYPVLLNFSNPLCETDKHRKT